MATTLVACAALLTVAGGAAAQEIIERSAEAPVARRANAHARPEALSYQQQFAELWAIEAEQLRFALGEAAVFEQAALKDARESRAPDIDRDTGPLGLGRRLDRLAGGRDQTFLCFGSGVHLSGQPHAPLS